MGSCEIVKKLNAQRIETFYRTGPRTPQKVAEGKRPIWRPKVVHSLLTNEAVIGWSTPHRLIYDEEGNSRREPTGEKNKIYPDDILVPDDAKASEALFYRVQAGLKDRQKVRGRKGNVVNLLTGLCRCGVCGAAVLVKTGGGGRGRARGGYMRCEGYLNRACSNKSRIAYQPFEATLLEMGPVGIKAIIAGLIPKPTDDLLQQLDDREAKIITMRRQVSELIQTFVGRREGPAKQAAMEQIDRLEAEIETEEDELGKARKRAKIIEHNDDGGLRERFAAARAKLDTDDPEEKRDARITLRHELRRIVLQAVLQPENRLSIALHVDDERGDPLTWQYCDRSVEKVMPPINVSGPKPENQEISMALSPATHQQWLGYYMDNRGAILVKGNKVRKWRIPKTRPSRI